MLQSQRAGQRIVVLRQPIGVCAAITPWNSPAAMITRKVGPALAAGCTIVVKPAELTQLRAFALGVLAIEAGLPPAVLQIVTGDAPVIGAALCESEVVRKLSFTGSTGVGRIRRDGQRRRVRPGGLPVHRRPPPHRGVRERLDTGMVGINTSLISNEVAPFGGVKQSGLGREGSRHGIEDYLELKYLCLQGRRAVLRPVVRRHTRVAPARNRAVCALRPTPSGSSPA